MKKYSKEKIVKLTTEAMLMAIIIIMSFTPLGYLKTGVIEITFIMVPVAVGSIICGSAAGAFLGLVFGITSFVQCFGMSPFGAALLEINPVLTFIVCIVPRVLAGLLPGLVYSAITKKNTVRQAVGTPVSSLLAPLLNTALFTSLLIICFGNTDYIQSMRAGKNILAFAAAFVGVQGLIEAAVCFAVSTAVCAAVNASMKRRTKSGKAV